MKSGPQSPKSALPRSTSVGSELTGNQPLAIEARNLGADLPTGLGLRRKTILQGIQLELPIGQVLGLLGPNGSGKTTLLRHLAGLLRPTRGLALLFGVPSNDSAALARTTYLPEDSPFPPELTATQTLTLLASLRGHKGRAARMAQAEALERAGLKDTHRTPLARFSRGMLRRFGLAQAFLFQPDLVLLDEPTAGLDAPGLMILEEWIQEHRERGGSLVLCSHSLADLIQHTDRLALLWNGQLAMEGETHAQLSDPTRHSLTWRGPVDAQACQSYLEEQGATEIVGGTAWKGLMEVYRSIQQREDAGATATSPTQTGDAYSPPHGE